MRLSSFSPKYILFSMLFVISTACTTASHVKPLSDSSDSHIDPDAEMSAELSTQSVNFHQDLKQRGLLFSDKETNQYINKIGQSLAPDFMKEYFPLHFYIIKDATANAMALPNGNIYVNIGLLSVVENEDQLAAILAHEISHVIQRHSLKSKLIREDTIVAANIADIFLLGTGISYVAAYGNLAGFSREQEKEADLVGLKHILHAGYDINQAPEVFKLFQALPEFLTVNNSIYNSHPDNEERIRYLENYIRNKYPRSLTKPRAGENFSKTRAKIVESNVQIRLNNHQYRLALYTLEQAEAYYKKAPLIQYYRGEAYRLMAMDPKNAAIESLWLRGKLGKVHDESYFIENKQAHHEQANAYFLQALELKSDLALGYKGLGMLDYENNQYKKAIINFNIYLEKSKNPADRLYIKRLIRNSKRELGG